MVIAVKIFRILLLSCVCAFALLCPNKIEPRKVLVLQSYHVGQPMEDGFVRGLRQAADSSGLWVNYYFEYMDAKRFSHPILDTIFRKTLERKYGKMCFDALVTADNIALEFAFSNRTGLFQGLPLVFIGINDFTQATIEGQSNITGVTEDNDFSGTLKLISALQPKERDLYLISDLSETGFRMRNVANKELSGNPFWRVHWLQNESYQSLVDSLSLPGGVAVLLTFSTDRENKSYSEKQLIAMIGRNSKKAIYSMLAHQVSDGVVGGSVLSGDMHGNIAGNMLVKILNGVAAGSIPILEKSPKIQIVDHLALKRFSIDRSKVPPGTIILHAPFSIWQAYKVSIIALSLTFIVLVLVIIILLKMRIQLKESRKHYRELVERANSVILRMDPDGKIMYMNEYGETIFGYSLHEVAGLHVVGTIVPDVDTSGHKLSEMIQGICENPDAYLVNENENVTKDGRRIWMRWSNRPILNRRGDLESILAVGVDYTEKHRHEVEIARFNRKVAHDLRTPLVTISGFAAAILADLREDGISAVEKDIEYIQHAAAKMGSLLNDLAKMFRYGDIHSVHERIKLEELVEDARMIVAGALRANAVEISVTSKGWIVCDRERMVEVFQNILDNAIKFMGAQPAPRIEIGLELREGIPVLYFSDNGIGIAPGLVGTIFESYVRLVPDIPGTGLGLSLAKQVIEHHGGHIWAESPGIGCGTIILIQMPHLEVLV